MGVSRSAINSFARAVKQNGDTSSLWTPRAPQWSLQQGVVSGVDVGNSVAHVDFDGSGETAFGVRYIHQYGPDNPPQVDDVTYGHYNGHVMVLIGRQVVPNGPVTLS